jgi:hypothetical protein
LKKYRPYNKGNEEEDFNIHRVINIKKEFRDELNEKKKMLKQALITSVE